MLMCRVDEPCRWIIERDLGPISRKSPGAGRQGPPSKPAMSRAARRIAVSAAPSSALSVLASVGSAAVSDQGAGLVGGNVPVNTDASDPLAVTAEKLAHSRR